jgi:anti-repressor protein
MNMKSIVINESGLYSAIIGSQKPEAKKFKKWVTSEVLPALRKHGGYIIDQENISGEELLAKAL